MVGKLETRNVETVSELFALADKYAWEAEAWSRSERRGKESASQEQTKLNRPGDKRNKRKAVAALAMEGRNKQHAGRVPGGGAPRPNGNFKKLAPDSQGAKRWCKIHQTNRHDLTECRAVKGLAENH